MCIGCLLSEDSGMCIGCLLSVRGQWYVYRLFVISQRTVVCV